MTGSRRRLLLAVAVAQLTTSMAFAQSKFPYLAYVRNDETIVRAGPGKHYYGTDRVKRGAHVEVYRHVGRWCAIRPPRSSFSWIPATAAKLTSDPTIAVITRSDVKSSIGTNLRIRGRRKFQIVLKKGEKVEVLGARRVRSRTSQQPVVWYKISPPAGEFRWLEYSDVMPVPRPRSQVRVASARKETKQGLVFRTPPAERKPAIVLREPGLLNADRAARPLDSVAQQEPGRKGSSSVVTFEHPVEKTERITRTQELQAPRTPANKLPDNDSLQALELDLSLMVASDRRRWNLPGLRQRATRLMQSQSDTLGRARARRVIARIDKFTGVASSEKTQPMTISDIRPASSSVAVTKKTPTKVKPRANLPSGFDGFGYLWPVSSRDSNDPPYALVSADGKFIQFVSPAPGVSLHAYLQKKVAIKGQRGYSRKWKKPHLTAERIVERK